jgi:hypothetical protein
MIAWAMVCLLKHDGNISLAAPDFKMNPPEELPERPLDSLRAVWNRWERDEIKLPGRSKPTRAKKLSDEEAKDVADAFVEGHTGKREGQPFSTVAEVRPKFHRRAAPSAPHSALSSPLQACQHHPLLKSLVSDRGFTPDYLWKRAKKVDPELHSIGVVLKAALSSRVKEERKRAASVLLRMPASTFMNAIYLDESWFKTRAAPSGRALARQKANLVEEIQMPLGYDLPKEAQGTMFLFLAVHPLLGLIHWELLSPTTGHPRKGKHKVSYT